MSAISLPMLRSAKATTAPPVNAEQIETYDGFDRPAALPGSGLTTYLVIFHLKNYDFDKIITWTYPSEAERDADLAQIHVAIATTLAA